MIFYIIFSKEFNLTNGVFTTREVISFAISMKLFFKMQIKSPILIIIVFNDLLYNFLKRI